MGTPHITLDALREQIESDLDWKQKHRADGKRYRPGEGIIDAGNGDAAMYMERAPKITKAFSRQADSDKAPSKKPKPAGKASAKKVGQGSNSTRYDYPGEKGGDKPAKPKEFGNAVVTPEKGAPAAGGEPTETEGPQQAPVQTPNRKAQANPADFIKQLGLSEKVLNKIAERFRSQPELKGRDGFIKFMLTQLAPVVKKHNLDGDYFGGLYDALKDAPKPA